MKTLLEIDFVATSELEQRMSERTISERQGGSVPFVRYQGLKGEIPSYCVIDSTKQECAKLIHRIVQIPRLNVEYLKELLYTPAENRGPGMNQVRAEILERLTSHRITHMEGTADGQTRVIYEGGETVVSHAVLDELACVLSDLQGDKK